MDTPPSPDSRRSARRQHLREQLDLGKITPAHYARQTARMTSAAMGEGPRIKKRIKAIRRRYQRGEYDLTEMVRKLIIQRERWYEMGIQEDLPLDLVGLRLPLPGLSQASAGTDAEAWREKCAKGGSAKTEAKAAALAALHEARRGVPLHPLPAKVAAALTCVRELLHAWQTCGSRPLRTSVKQFAREQEVDPRSVRRWLDGQLRPAPGYQAAIVAWAAHCKAAAKALIDSGHEPPNK
jgi:hypothetical protein